MLTPANLKSLNCYLFPGQTVQNTRKWGRITWPGEPRNSHLMRKFAIKSPGQCIHSHFCVSWLRLNAYMPANLKSFNCYAINKIRIEPISIWGGSQHNFKQNCLLGITFRGCREINPTSNTDKFSAQPLQVYLIEN